MPDQGARDRAAINVPAVERLMAAYLLTLNATSENEWFATNREFAEEELARFLLWLKDEPIPKRIWV
jgi:hypothetical protein